MTETAQQERVSALDEFAALKSDRAPTQYQALPGGNDLIAHGSMPVHAPRDEGKILQRLKTLAAAMGDDWFFRFPVKNRKHNRTDYIEGPSIKLANELARIWGNCEVDCRTQDMGDYWLIHARFIDLETGFALTRPFQQSKSGGRLGGDDDNRRLEIAHSIGISKAERNVVVNALSSFATFAFEEARNSLVDKIGRDLPAWRERTAERIAANVDLARVEAVIGRKAAEWLAPDIARTIALMKGVTDGMASLDETFPPLAGKSNAAASSTSALDAFVSGQSGDAGAGPQDDERLEPPLAARNNEDDNGAAGESSSHDEPAADLFSEIEARMSAAASPEVLDAIWDQMDLDAKLDGDPEGRGKANKIMAKRQRELKK